MKIVFIILAIFSILATCIKLIKKDVWWIRVFDFPQAQYTFLGFIALAGLFLSESFDSFFLIVLLVILIGCLIYQLTIIIPYTFIYPVQVQKAMIADLKDKNALSIMVTNVYQYNKEYERCISVVEKEESDIVIAVETSDKWEEVFTSRIGEKYKYKCLKPQNNTYGMLLYSKLKLHDTKIRYTIRDDVPSIHTRIELKSGRIIHLYCIHPEPPSPTEADYSTERDAELYLTGKEVRDHDDPVIVAGDLNDVAWSKSTSKFQRISGLLDPRIGRGFFNTFHAKYPFIRWPLDHIFHSDHFKLISMHRCSKTGSDHFPILVNLHCDGDYTSDQLRPEPDKEDIEESEEKINEAVN